VTETVAGTTNPNFNYENRFSYTPVTDQVRSNFQRHFDTNWVLLVSQKSAVVCPPCFLRVMF
jgi:hypothetical protein